MEEEIRSGRFKVRGDPKRYATSYMVEKYARMYPNKPYCYYGDKVLTRKENQEHANQIARALLDFGVKRGDRVGQMVHNCTEFMDVQGACWKIGAYPTTVNYRYTSRELKYVVNNAQMSVLFFTDDLIDVVRGAKDEMKSVKQFVVLGEDVPSGMVSYKDMLREYPKTKPEIPWGEPDATDLAFLAYTGGTTGMPKGVMWRHIEAMGMLTSWIYDPAFLGQILDKLSNAPKELTESLAKGISMPFISSILDMQPVRRLLRSSLLAQVGGKLVAEMLPFLVTSGALAPFTTNVPALLQSPLIEGNGAATSAVLPMFGMPVVLLTKRPYDPIEVLETIEKRKVFFTNFVGDAFAKPIADVLERNPGKYNLSSVAILFSVGHTWSPPRQKNNPQTHAWRASFRYLICDGGNISRGPIQYVGR